MAKYYVKLLKLVCDGLKLTLYFCACFKINSIGLQGNWISSIHNKQNCTIINVKLLKRISDGLK